MRVFTTLMIGCALALGGWQKTVLADPFKLNSGKIVDILAVGKVKTAQGPALKMQFRSKTLHSDAFMLRREANELWEHFVVNVNRGGFRRAVISAMGPKKGAATKPVDFIFVKRTSGWRTLENGLGPKDKLTESFLRKGADRSRRLKFHRNYNAMLLYMAKDWSITYTYPRRTGIEPFWIDRETLIEWNERLWKQSKTGSKLDLSGQMEIVKINILNKGMTAQAEIRVAGQMNIRGQLVSIAGRYITQIELRQRALVATHAYMMVEDIGVAVEH